MAAYAGLKLKGGIYRAELQLRIEAAYRIVVMERGSKTSYKVRGGKRTEIEKWGSVND